MIEMSFTADARRIASAAASGLAGRPIKMQVEPGGTPQAVVPRHAGRRHRTEAHAAAPNKTRSCNA